MQIRRKRKIECRVSNTELLILKKKADQVGVTLSEYIRGTALNYELAYKLSEDEIQSYKQLSELKNNFQRIANYMKYKATDELRRAIMETIELVNKHLKKFQSMIAKAKACVGGSKLIGYVINEKKGYALERCNLSGENPSELFASMQVIQNQNLRCQNNTISIAQAMEIN